MSCISGYYLHIDNMCYTECPAHFYGNNISFKCNQCPYDCLTCNSFRRCITCSVSDNRIFANVTERCVPMQGYYESLVTIASECSLGCAVCISYSWCNACIFGFTLDPATRTCGSQCNPRFYLSNSTNQCDPCPYDCLECSSGGICLACSNATDFRVMNKTSSRCIPLSGYFDDGNVICAKCPQGCLACLNFTLCINCQQGFYLRGDSLCATACP